MMKRRRCYQCFLVACFLIANFFLFNPVIGITALQAAPGPPTETNVDATISYAESLLDQLKGANISGNTGDYEEISEILKKAKQERQRGEQEEALEQATKAIEAVERALAEKGE